MSPVSATVLVELVLVIGLLELLVLLALRRQALVFTLLAGLGLMLALRLVVAGAALHWVALALVASGVLHIVDLWRRWSSKSGYFAFKRIPIPQRERSP